MTTTDIDALHAAALVINQQDDQLARTFRSATTPVLGMVLDQPRFDTVLDDWTYARRLRLIRNELHTRALAEHATLGTPPA